MKMLNGPSITGSVGGFNFGISTGDSEEESSSESSSPASAPSSSAAPALSKNSLIYGAIALVVGFFVVRKL